VISYLNPERCFSAPTLVLPPNLSLTDRLFFFHQTSPSTDRLFFFHQTSPSADRLFVHFFTSFTSPSIDRLFVHFFTFFTSSPSSLLHLLHFFTFFTSSPSSLRASRYLIDRLNLIDQEEPT
jgi:hypothetical protein